MISPKPHRSCPVCGSYDAEHLHRQRFVLPEGHPLADGYDVVCCVICGFIYADTRATQKDYDLFYEAFSKYEDTAHSTGSGEFGEDLSRLEDTARILEDVLVSHNDRILDIGCATGGLLAALQRHGYSQLTGIDPSPVCAAHTERKIGRAFQGSISSLPEGIGVFDAVILSHVLEHLLDVPQAVAAMQFLLAPGGILFLEVPDAQRYADYVYAPFQDFNTEHINHFSGQSLDNAVAGRGFSVVGAGNRLLHASRSTFTPAIYRLYRQTGQARPITPDRELKSAIMRYIERSATLLAQIDSCIAEELTGSSELIVWGTGQLTLKLLAETSLFGAKVVAFVDSNPIHHGRRLAGAPILAPHALHSLSQPILVSTLLHHREIVGQIRSLGLPNRVILLPESRSSYGKTSA